MEPLPSKHKANLTEMKIQMKMFSLADLRTNQLESEMVCGWLIFESWFCGNPVPKLRTKKRDFYRFCNGGLVIVTWFSWQCQILHLTLESQHTPHSSYAFLLGSYESQKCNLDSLYTLQERQLMQAVWWHLKCKRRENWQSNAQEWRSNRERNNTCIVRGCSVQLSNDPISKRNQNSS